MIKPTLLLFFTAFSIHTNAQFTGIQWQKSLGGSADDYANDGKQTTDGGYIVTGRTESTNGDVAFNYGDKDYWVVKLDASGTIQWQKTYGGSNYDEATSIQQTFDGGYIVAGYSLSVDGDITGHHFGNITSDYWIVKLDGSGMLQWEKSLGGDNSDRAYSIQQTTDSGYIVAGWSYSTNGDVTGHNGTGSYADCWIVKIDSTGLTQWQKSLGGSDDDAAYSVSQTYDGGFIVGGGSWSTDGDITSNIGYSDYWVVKLDINGTIQWQKSYGGSDIEGIIAIEQTTDGGYIIGGDSDSNDGEVTGNHNGYDYWIVKIDSVGVIQWEKSLGGSNSEGCKSIQQTNEGGYIVVGYTPSNDGDVTGFHGLVGGDNVDCWIVKLDSLGILQWEEALGGTNGDGASCIQQTLDGGFLVAGISLSNDGDVTVNHGSADFWIVKLGPDVGIKEEINATSFDPIVFPNPSNGIFKVKMKGTEIKEIKISNALGEEILKKFIDDDLATIDLTSYTKGIYFIQIKSKTQKIIIQ